MTEATQSFKSKMQNALYCFIGLAFIGVLMHFCSDKSSSYTGSVSQYPKACKASCGQVIRGSVEDCDGYHCVCKPGKDGRSMMDRLR